MSVWRRLPMVLSRCRRDRLFGVGAAPAEATSVIAKIAAVIRG
jgi:hypothetical protein